MRSRTLWSGAIPVTVIGLVLSLLGACSPPAPQPRGGAAGINVPFVPEISINEIMVGQVDHSAHELLRLSLDDEPRITLGAWQELEHNAIQLISSTAAITMGGAGVNDAMWVAQSGWREYVGLLNEAAADALRASRSQDLPELLAAADAIRESCDGCHRQYKPEVPTEGFYRIH